MVGADDPTRNAALMDEVLARITAALGALAVGDALGRATEYNRPEELTEKYEELKADFLDPVRLFDDEAWAEGETGPATSLVLGVAAGRKSAVAAGAEDVAMLSLGVAWGLMGVSGAGGSQGESNPAMAAIAAGVSAGLAGEPATMMLSAAAEAARAAGAPSLGDAIIRAGGIAQATGGRHSGEALSGTFPPGGEAASVVPFVFGIAYAAQNARRAILEAVNQGGHAPETAALAGALCASLAPASLPRAWSGTVERTNGFDLSGAAAWFAAARARRAP
jgi:ADP-ribosylglycohydrolase